MKYVWGFLAVIVGIAALATLRPDILPITADLALTTPFVQLIALRAWLAIAFLGMALFFFIFSIIRHRMVNAGRIALGIAAVFFITGAIHAGTVYSRGLSAPAQLGPDTGITSGTQGDGSITVLSYNTLGGATAMTEIADSVDKNGADVVVLLETSSARGRELQAMLEERGLGFQEFDNGSDEYEAEFRSSVLLVSTELGEYRQTNTAPEQAAGVSAAPANGVGPSFVAVHPIAPLPQYADEWRSEIESVYGLCATNEPLIIAGDFNSTLDHQRALGYDCTDGAVEAGSGGIGTWPVRLPPLLGSPIDRVIHNIDEYVGSDAALLSVGDSDHHGVVVRLSPTN